MKKKSLSGKMIRVIASIYLLIMITCMPNLTSGEDTLHIFLRCSNMQYVGGYWPSYSFDIELKCLESNTYLGDASIQMFYNDSVFGTHVVQHQHLEYEKLFLLLGDLSGTAKYVLYGPVDTQPDKFGALAEASFIVPNPMYMNPIPDNYTGLINFRIHIHLSAQVTNLVWFDKENTFVNAYNPGFPMPHVDLTIIDCMCDTVNTDPMVYINANTILEGPYNGTHMHNTLYLSGLIPMAQPYNTYPWYYNGSEQISFPSAGIIDWVLLEMRKSQNGPGQAGSSTIVGRKAALLLQNGLIVDAYEPDKELLPGFEGAIDDSAYLVIHHRNHASIMSAISPQKASFCNTTFYQYNFTDDFQAAYGGLNAVKEVATGTYAMPGGDGNSNGQISNPDKVEVWGADAGKAGYLNGDFNLDGEVDNSDKMDIWWFNTGMGSQVPE